MCMDMGANPIWRTIGALTWMNAPKAMGQLKSS